VESLLLREDFDPAQPALVTARQKDCVRRAVAAIAEACNALELGLTYDALSVCIDEANDALLELTGGRATIDVVDRVFEKFCVGK
jgi:tRNA modification GTPase